MEENRNIIISSGIALALLMCLIALLILVSNPWEDLNNLAIGLAFGIGIGSILCLYIYRAWDPNSLGFKENPASSGCLLPIIFVSSALIVWSIYIYFPKNFLDVIVSCILSIITLLLFFLACLAWWYRPK